MKILSDSDTYDRLQIRLVREIAETIHDGLKKAGIFDTQVLFEMTGELTFAIAAIIDASRVMESDGEPVIPCLGFARSREYHEVLLEQGGSSMHEYAFGTVDEIDFWGSSEAGA